MKAKDFDKQGSKVMKKAYTYSNYELPVCVLSARTYKTGKHGHAKTSMNLKDYFTGKVFLDITNSDTEFSPLVLNPNYYTLNGIVSSKDSKDHMIQLLLQDYSTLTVQETDHFEDYDVGTDVAVSAFKTPSCTYYRLKPNTLDQ